MELSSSRPPILFAEFGYEGATSSSDSHIILFNTDNEYKPEPESKSFQIFRDMYIHSNSPILSSSSDNSDTEIEPIELQELGKWSSSSSRKKTSSLPEYKKLSFNDVEASLGKFVVSEKEALSIYLQAKSSIFTSISNSYRNNYFILNGLGFLFSLFIAIFSSFVLNHVAVICVNGVISFCFFLNFSQHYDANHILFLYSAKSIGKINVDSLTASSEIKEALSILPPVYRPVFAFVYNLDIFRLFEFVTLLRNEAVHSLTDTKNEIGRILYRWNAENSLQKWKSGEALSTFLQTKQKEENRLVILMEKKEKLKRDIDEYHLVYSHVVDLIQLEIAYSEWIGGWIVFGINPYLNSYRKIYSKIHPSIKKYLPPLFNTN